MIDRLILSAVLSVVGWNGLFPDPPPPVTPLMLKQKAKERQRSEICLRKNNKHQSNAVKRMCKRWKEQQGA
jgi:hypothetical protein